MRKPEFPLGYQVSGNIQTVGYEEMPKGFPKYRTCSRDMVKQASQPDLILLLTLMIKAAAATCTRVYTCRSHALFWSVTMNEFS